MLSLLSRIPSWAPWIAALTAVLAILATVQRRRRRRIIRPIAMSEADESWIQLRDDLDHYLISGRWPTRELERKERKAG